MGNGWTRRDFLKAGPAGLALGAATSAWGRRAGAARQPLRCGFIGVGGRGSALLRTVLDLEGVEVVAVCDIDAGNLERGVDLVKEARGEMPEALGEGPYQYRELLASDGVDCVVIATPCYWHSTMYFDALNAGMHFYGEKPLAITVKGVELIQEARRRHPEVVIQIGFQWGAHQGRADAVRQVHEGAIGDLIEGRFHRYNGWGSLGRWLDRRELSGDWMLEQAVHEFNLMWWVTRAHPLAAYARGRRHVIEPDNPERDVTDIYIALLEYPGDLIVHYAHGWIDPPGYGGMSTRFVGTQGGLDVLGASLQIGDQQIAGDGPGGDTREHLDNFLQAVRAGRPEMCSCGLDNGIAASYVGLMIRKALDEQRRITFEEMIRDNQDFPPLPPA